MGQEIVIQGAPVQTRAPIPIDILFPVHGKPELTVKNIKAIFSFTTVPFHLVILDDTDASIEQGSFHRVEPTDITSPFCERLARLNSNVTYINRPKPFKEGNEFFNLGFSYCKHNYIATIMNSITVQPEWELHALQLFQEQPDIGIVALKCLFPTGTIESAGIIFDHYTPCDYGRDAPGYALTLDKEMPAAQWAFALLRKKAVVGNLEEGIFHGFVGWDDIDNCMAVRSKGWKVHYCGHGVGIHQPRATRGSDLLEAFLKNKENSFAFYKRWGLWNMYQEGQKMDVSYKLTPETKAKLSAVVLELQVLQNLTQERQNILKSLGTEAMKELGVAPDKFSLEMNPQQNLWQLRQMPDNGQGDTAKLEQTTEQVKGASPAQSQKRQKVKR